MSFVEVLSICVSMCVFPFISDVRMWDLIVLIPDHCLSIHFMCVMCHITDITGKKEETRFYEKKDTSHHKNAVSFLVLNTEAMNGIFAVHCNFSAVLCVFIIHLRQYFIFLPLYIVFSPCK